MFAKFSTLALALPLVSALSIYTPSNWSVPGTVTLQWAGSTSDPSSFSIELVAVSFHDTYALANNVALSQGQITFSLPQISPGSYSIEFVSVNNVTDVYAEAGPFTIAAASTTSSPSSTDTSTGSLTTMSTLSTPALTTTPLTSASSTPATSGTSSAPTTTPSNFNQNGAASFKLTGIAPAAALVLSAVAGAAMVF